MNTTDTGNTAASTNETTTIDQRTIAVHRLQTRADFYRFLLIWLGVSALMVAVWAASGFGYFWPAWVIASMGIAAYVKAFKAFGPGRNGITESAINAELAKLTRSDQ